MTMVYLGQQVRVLKADHHPALVGRTLYLDDVGTYAVTGCYFVDGDPNDDGDIANNNDDYGWVEAIEPIYNGSMLDRERYFDDKGFRKGYALPVLVKSVMLAANPDGTGEQTTLPVEPDGTVKAPTHDPVNHPSHYTGMPNGIECIDVIEWMNLCRGNAIKYIWRAGQKDPAKEVEDLEKAIWFIKREIDRLKRVSA